MIILPKHMSFELNLELLRFALEGLQATSELSFEVQH